MNIQAALRRYGLNVEVWKEEQKYRRRQKGDFGVVYQNDWSFIEEIKRILERVEPGIWISREQLKNKDIIRFVEYIYDLLGCQASLFLQLFSEKVESKKNGNGNV